MHLREGYAHQYDSPAVIVEGSFSDEKDADTIITMARELRAECDWECEPDEAPDLVIAFVELRGNEPEVYTEEAVRDTVVGVLHRERLTQA